MSTGPQNYLEAEECLARAAHASDRGRNEDAAFWHREALVRSNLALAAATALNDADGGLSRAEWNAWNDTAGTRAAEEAQQ